MSDSKVHCGLYDPDRSTDDLLFITTQAAREARLGPDVGASVVPVRFNGRGGLVDVQIEYSDLAPELLRPWTAMGARLADVITYVQPAIAAVDRYLRPELLPSLTWEDARTLLAVGWVRMGTLTPEQRDAFEALRLRRLVRPHGGGLVWGGSGEMWSLTDGILRGAGEDITAAVFEAWTGTPASPRSPPSRRSPSWTSRPAVSRRTRTS